MNESQEGALIYLDDNYCIKVYEKDPSLPTVIAFSNRGEEYIKKHDFEREFGKSAFLSLPINYVSFVTNENCWYQHDTAKAISALQDALSTCTGKKITYGCSMGGYAAIAFSKELSAEFLSFSPQASIDRSFMSEIGDKRWLQEQDQLTPFTSNIMRNMLTDTKGIVFFDGSHKDYEHAQVILKKTSGTGCDLPHSGHGSVSAVNTTYGLKKLVVSLYVDGTEATEILSHITRSWENSIEFLACIDYELFIDRLEANNFKISRIAFRNIFVAIRKNKYPKSFLDYLPQIFKNSSWMTEAKIVQLKKLLNAPDIESPLKTLKNKKNFFDLATENQRNADFDNALKYLDLSIKSDEKVADSYYRKAQIYNKLNNHKEALFNIKNAISIDSTVAHYHEMLGNFYLKDGYLIDAEMCYLRCLDIDFKRSRSHFRLCKLYEMSNRLEESVYHIQSAIALEDTNPLYRYQYGEVLIRMNDIESAVREKKIASDLSPDKYSFSNDEINLRAKLYSGEIVFIPAGFRCYTKGIIYRKFKFNQPSLPFDSGFFSPKSIASILKKPIVKLSMNTHSVCIKKESYSEEPLGLGISFQRSTYNEINSLIHNGKNVGSYLDSTSGYYTLDNEHEFILAHYNWHKSADHEKSKGIYDVNENLSIINNTFNKRINRMFEMCNKAKNIFFIFGNTQDYDFIKIDNEVITFDNLEMIRDAATAAFSAHVNVLFLEDIKSAKDILDLIGN